MEMADCGKEAEKPSKVLIFGFLKPPLPHMLQSPVTGNHNAVELERIDPNVFITQFKNEYGIDVARFFSNVDFVKKCLCQDTGYRFFLPEQIAGDGEFYKQLQAFDWYYEPWKWEHQMAYAMCQKSDKILEVGSGSNSFVERLHNEGYDITGLELNPDSIERAKAKGLRVQPQFVQQHALDLPEAYDKVFSFQVLEHISDVKGFIDGQIGCLKPGGKLVVCVPNNDSFIQHSSFALNLPPHHMGHWERSSLEKLTKFFPLVLNEVRFEPLRDSHVQWYQNTMEDVLIKNRILRSLFRRSPLKKIYAARIKNNLNKIEGMSIMAIYTKK